MIKERLQAHIEEIINLHQQGISQKEIAKKFATSASSIGRILRSNGFCERNQLTKEEINNVCLMYQNGFTIESIARNFKKSQCTISGILKQNGIKIKSLSERNKKYTLNEHYFDDIDNQNKAYIFGFLMADGNVFRNRLSISLQERDVDILDKINKCLGSNRPLRFIDYKSKYPDAKYIQNQRALTIVNTVLVDQLKKLGLVENKSLILTMPEWITDDLFIHLLRGLIDGDGTIEKKRHRISLIGTFDIVNSIHDKLYQIFQIDSYIYKDKRHQNSYILCVGGKNNSTKLIELMYRDANLYLNRKFQIAKTYYLNNSSAD